MAVRATSLYSGEMMKGPEEGPPSLVTTQHSVIFNQLLKAGSTSILEYSEYQIHFLC